MITEITIHTYNLGESKVPSEAHSRRENTAPTYDHPQVANLQQTLISALVALMCANVLGTARFAKYAG